MGMSSDAYKLNHECASTSDLITHTRIKCYPGDLDFCDPVTPKSIGFLCYHGWMCLRKVGQGLLELLIGNAFGTFNPSDFDL